MNNKQIDLRTPLQKKRDERNKEIFSQYTSYMSNLPDGAAQWSVFRVLAEQFGMKPQGIRTVIKKMQQTAEQTN